MDPRRALRADAGRGVAIGDLIPLIGATLASIVVIAVAYFSRGTMDGIIVFVVIMAYQQIENHVLQPLIYRRTVQIPALVVLIAVLIGAALLGILGALVAIPIAGTIQVIVKDLLEARAERLRREERLSRSSPRRRRCDVAASPGMPTSASVRPCRAGYARTIAAGWPGSASIPWDAPAGGWAAMLPTPRAGNLITPLDRRRACAGTHGAGDRTGVLVGVADRLVSVARSS